MGRREFLLKAAALAGLVPLAAKVQPEVQNQEMKVLAYRLHKAVVRHANTRSVSAASILRYGKISIDAEGNLLPMSSGAAVAAI